MDVIELLKRDEDFRAKPYKCPTGHLDVAVTGRVLLTNWAQSKQGGCGGNRI